MFHVPDWASDVNANVLGCFPFLKASSGLGSVWVWLGCRSRGLLAEHVSAQPGSPRQLVNLDQTHGGESARLSCASAAHRASRFHQSLACVIQSCQIIVEMFCFCSQPTLSP